MMCRFMMLQIQQELQRHRKKNALLSLTQDKIPVCSLSQESHLSSEITGALTSLQNGELHLFRGLFGFERLLLKRKGKKDTETEREKCWSTCQISTQASMWPWQPEDGLCKTWRSFSAVVSTQDRQTGGWDYFQTGLQWGVNTNTAQTETRGLEALSSPALYTETSHCVLNSHCTSVSTHPTFLSPIVGGSQTRYF